MYNPFFYFFTTIDKQNRKIKVVVFNIDENLTIADTSHYYPRDSHPTTPKELLDNPKSPIINAAKKQKLIIVEDTQNPPQNIEFMKAKDDERRGSLICYPILIPRLKRVRMVVSVFAPHSPGYFQEYQRRVYDFVLERFRKRLAIEYCLLLLKKQLQN